MQNNIILTVFFKNEHLVVIVQFLDWVQLKVIQGVSKKLRESGAHKTAFLDIFFFFDVQDVGTYLFTDFL